MQGVGFRHVIEPAFEGFGVPFFARRAHMPSTRSSTMSVASTPSEREREKESERERERERERDRHRDRQT